MHGPSNIILVIRCPFTRAGHGGLLAPSRHGGPPGPVMRYRAWSIATQRIAAGLLIVGYTRPLVYVWRSMFVVGLV